MPVRVGTRSITQDRCQRSMLPSSIQKRSFGQFDAARDAIDKLCSTSLLYGYGGTTPNDFPSIGTSGACSRSTRLVSRFTATRDPSGSALSPPSPNDRSSDRAALNRLDETVHACPLAVL